MKQTKLLFAIAACTFFTVNRTHATPNPSDYHYFHRAHTVTGTVVDIISREPLAGASIQVKGTTQGTSTDKDGKFTLQLENANATLEVSYSNYATQEIAVKGQNTVTIELSHSISNMNEVVVVGYGTQKKGDVTSAVASIKSENFVKGAVRDAAQLIQGKVAGLSISTSSGDPTANTQIQLRGITTLKAGAQPLVLIDGIPGTLNSVAPEDIEAIDVLKDGSAAAIYGTRGTNGVILITTRRVHGDAKSTLEYNGYVSVQTIARKLDFLDAADYRKYIGEGIGFTDFGTSTNWLDEITRTPVSHTHNLTWQGGSRTTNFTASLNYRNWQGIFLKSDNKQITGRADLNHSMFDGKLKFNLNVVSRTQTYWAGGNGSSFNNYIYRQALIRNPTDSVRNYKGDWMERGVQEYDNPVAYIKETNGETIQKEVRTSGNLTFTPIKDLHLKLLVSNVSRNMQRGFAQTKKHMSTTKNGLNGFAAIANSAFKDNMVEFTTDYTKNIGDHRLTVLAGGSYQNVKNSSNSMENWDFPNDFYSYNRMESGNALGRGEARMTSNANEYTLIGFFGRVNYVYNDKYMAMVSVRQEASSKFGENHKWGTFPAVSLGWRINRESFLENVEAISDLKLRAGYGVTGISPDDSYLSQTSLNYGNRVLINGVWMQSLAPVRNPNPDLRWERKEEYNVGLDFALFNNRLSGTIDAYRRLTKDMLWDYQVPVPPFLFNSITANVGSIRNTGVEVLLNYDVFRTKNLQWTTSANFSTNTNVLVSLSNDQFKTTNDYFDVGATGAPIQQSTHRVKIGGPIGNFYGYKSVDIDDQGKWIIEGADGKPKPISQSSEKDKKILGNGLPKYYAGWNNSVRYKNWDLNVMLRGAFGYKILNFTRMFYENTKVVQYNMLKTAFDKVYGKTRLTNDLAYVSYYVEKGDYLKLDNITLGYSLPFKNNKIVRGARIYVTGLNLATITGYKGIDPEVSRSGLTPGNDEANKYPTTTSFTFGVNFSL